MRISKREFLKLLGGGAVAVPITKAHVERNAQPELQPVPQVGSRASAATSVYDPEVPWYDIVDRMLYDRIHFRGRIPQRFTMFSIPVGEWCPYSGVTKWHEHTNMVAAQHLPVPAMFWVKRIHIMVDRAASREDLRVLDRFAWNFWLGQKRYADGPVLKDSRLASGLRDLLRLRQPVARQSLELHASNGLFIPTQMRFYADFESSAQDFQLTLDPKSDGVDIFMGLEGVEARAVQ